jgi:hypothetical protein
MSENYLHSQSASSYDSISSKLEGNIPVGLVIFFLQFHIIVNKYDFMCVAQNMKRMKEEKMYQYCLLFFTGQKSISL